MKQSTLFSVFTKNTTLNGTSDHLDHSECNNVKVETNADKPKNTLKHEDKLTAPAKSSLALDVSPNNNVRTTKVNEVLVLDDELYNEDKTNTTRGEDINCKLQGKLSLSCVKKPNAEGSSENNSESKSESKKQIEVTGKFVTVQTAPLKVHSRIKENKQNTVQEHLDTQLPSAAVEKKGENSIDYADFLAQLSHKNDKEIQQNIEVSTLCPDIEDNETKKVMSYSEFLCMFKTPPKVEESAITIDDDDEPEKCPPPLPFAEQQKEVKCKSIASFFTKIESKPQKINSSDVAIVTVIAEVHSPSSSVEHRKSKEPTRTMKMPGKIDRLKDDNCEIEFLSSETITEVEVDVRKKVQGTKRNSETASLLLQVSKKPKVEQESGSHKQTVETTVKKSKSETRSDVSMKAIMETRTISEKNNCLHGEDKTSNDVAKIEPGTPVTTLASSAKSLQSTLHFGTSGLSVKKTAGMKVDTDTEEDSGSAAKILAKKRIEKQPSRRNKLSSEEEKTLKIHEDRGKEECESEAESEEKDTNLCKREDTSRDCKEPAASMEELSQTATTENMEIGEVTAQMKTEETGSLRRSARLAQSCHASKDVDVVEITSDDEEDMDLHEPKKRGRKVAVPKSSTAGGSPGGDWLVKTKGKLAPIFTSVKSKELVGKVLLAAVDPEQERLRREFLMSGIPDELKRHIATTAANTNLVLDYPPLPTISHVQQTSADDCLSVEIKMPKLRVLDDSINSTVGMWDSLGWQKTQNVAELHRDPFKLFTANPSVQGQQVGLLLQELQCCDGKFPFRRTYEHLYSKVVSSEIAFIVKEKIYSSTATDITGTKPTVIDVEAIDDDDVIVCDASHISDLHPLKNTSELKASLWSDLHQPESSEHIIGNTKAMKQLKEWLEEWKVVLEKQVRKASKINKNTSKNKNKGGWSDDSDFTDSEEEEETLCNSVLITGAHGIGKTASVYALAKELGYKVFEVNSSSLRSGKQLLAQLEEATQSHRVAQNKNKSAGISDTPPAGSSKKLDMAKGINSVPKPKMGTSAAFANLFRLTQQAGETNSKTSQSKKRESKLTSSKESRSGGIKKNGETPSQKITESVPARSQRKKKNEVLAEMGATKVKNHKNEDKKVGVKSQSNGECGLTSGSLNLTSASLILFDEVDVVFEEDKGFLATVQHFMMSTKIPIVLTSTDAAFHLQLQARHDHIRLSQPPLVSAASFLSTLCLAHGIRISHHSVLNALHYTKGDIRRCLLNLQYWCESGGGIVQIATDVDPNSLKNIDIVNEKSVTGNLLAKTFRSRMVSTDDSNDSDFISLRPPRKKAKRMTSDDDSSMDTFTAVENSSISSPKSNKIGTLSVNRRGSKSKSISSRNQVNVIMEDASSTEGCQLPLVHTGFEGSLLGLHDCDMSLAALMDLIKTSALSCQTLDHAVNTFSVIAKALNNDLIHHVALHSLPLPKVDQITPAQLTIPAPLEAVALEGASSKKSRRRIIQGDWMDSDSSDADSQLGKNVPQESTNVDEHSQDNSSCKIDSDIKELSVNSIPKTELSERNKVTNGTNITETESKPSRNSLKKSVLAEFTRYYDNLSYIDCLERKSSATDFVQGIPIFPGLSDDETHHSKLVDHTRLDKLQCYTGYVKVLAARHFCSNIGESVKNYEQYSDGHVDTEDSSNVANCKGSDRQAGTHVTDWPEELNLPLQNTLPDLWSIAEKLQNRNISSDSAFRNVSKCLPVVQSSDPALSLDYLPYLRDICRSEDGRRLAKTQRRFHHYLNSIGISLKESTIASLTSTYVVVPNNKQQDS